MSDIEKAVAGGAENIAANQAAFAESQKAGPGTPCDTSDAGLRSRGVGLATDLTSPGGPWHGLPADAATDPNSADWAENQRWACVEGGTNGSFFVATHDGSHTIGDHAENVRGYAHPSKAGYQNLNAHPQGDSRLAYALEIGNGLANCTLDPGFFVAEFAGE